MGETLIKGSFTMNGAGELPGSVHYIQQPANNPQQKLSTNWMMVQSTYSVTAVASCFIEYFGVSYRKEQEGEAMTSQHSPERLAIVTGASFSRFGVRTIIACPGERKKTNQIICKDRCRPWVCAVNT